TVEIAEEDGLELDRVLAAMGQLGAEAVLAGPAGHPLHEVAVDGGGAERRRVVLPRERERIAHARVTGAEDHEEVAVAGLGEPTVGPGVCGAAPVEVDVGGDRAA